MKFALESKQVTLPSEPEVAPTVESISETYEGLLTSYMELSDAQRDLDEVCQVMENIELSMKMIKTSDKVIECLNVDGSLEALCNTKELSSTIVTASLENAMTDVLKSFWEKVKAFFAKIGEYLKRLLPTREKVVYQTKEKIVEVIKEVEKPVEVVKTVEKEVVKEVVKKEDLFKKEVPLERFPMLTKFLYRNKINDFIKSIQIAVSTVTGDSDIAPKELPEKYPQYFKEKVGTPMPTWEHYETAKEWIKTPNDGGSVSLTMLGYNSENDFNELAKAMDYLSRIAGPMEDNLRTTKDLMAVIDKDDPDHDEDDDNMSADRIAKKKARIRLRLNNAINATRWISSASAYIQNTMLNLLRVLTYKEKAEES